MRFVVLVKATKDSESGMLPTTEEFAAMGAFNETLVKDGILLAADGLKPSSAGARLRYDGGRTTVTDGPFAETKELVAGFWIVQCRSKEEVIERFSHVPFSHGESIEIRPVFEAEDFGEALTPELRERERSQEERMREQVK